MFKNLFIHENETYDQFVSRMGNSMINYANNNNIPFDCLIKDILEYEYRESQKLYIYVLIINEITDSSILDSRIRELRVCESDFVTDMKRDDGSVVLIFNTKKAASEAFMMLMKSHVAVSRIEKVEMPPVE